MRTKTIIRTPHLQQTLSFLRPRNGSKMKQPRISVIIPNLNHGRFLERAICSTFDQDYENIQVIVIDGASTDTSRPIIKIYQHRINFWSSKPDSGIAHALNLGLRQADGDIITYLPSNQVMLPETLHNIAKKMTGKNPAKWAVGHQQLTDEYDNPIGQIESSLPNTTLDYLKRDSGYLPLAGSFYHKDLLNLDNIFDTHMHYNYSFELNARLLIQGHQPHLIKHQLTSQRYHKGTQSAIQTIQNGMEQIEIAEQFALNMKNSDKQEILNNCNKRRKIYVLAQAEVYGDQAKHYLRRELFKNPSWLNDKSFRDVLANGVKHPVPHKQVRKAA